jgi:hypothetical protein
MTPFKSSNPLRLRSDMVYRGFPQVVLVIFFAAACFSLSSCSSNPKKKSNPQSAVLQQKLPKPASMRVAQDSNTKRKPPLLPKTIVSIPDDANPAPSFDDSSASSQAKVVDSTTPKFINNEQTQDFFQGAGDGPAGENVLGSFFDTVFRPANAANQPVSSTSYTVE